MKNKILTAILVIASFTSFISVCRANDAPSVTSLFLVPESGITYIFASASLNVTFGDDATTGTYTVTVDWGDGSTSSATVASTGATSYTTGYIHHACITSGVFEIKVTVTDGLGASSAEVPGTSTYQYIAVAIQDNDFTHQGGWFNTVAGSLASNLSYSGRVNLGSICRPNGNGNKGDLDLSINGENFVVTTITPVAWDYLTISGCCLAMFRGNVTVNGSGAYKVLVALTDNGTPCSGFGGNNKVRVKIYNPSNNDILFDSQPGNADNALPTTTFQQGNVQVHVHYTCRLDGEQAENVFDMMAYPNPSAGNTLLRFTTASACGYHLNLFDMVGQKVFEAQGISAEGENALSVSTSGLAAGIYHLRLNTENETVAMKLVIAR